MDLLAWYKNPGFYASLATEEVALSSLKQDFLLQIHFLLVLIFVIPPSRL